MIICAIWPETADMLPLPVAEFPERSAEKRKVIDYNRLVEYLNHVNEQGNRAGC
jgi:hypothetical protein